MPHTRVAQQRIRVAVLCIAIYCGASQSFGQTATILSGVTDGARQAGLLPIPPNKQPTALVGFPTEPNDRHGTLPTPRDVKNPNAFELHSPGPGKGEGDFISAEGPLELHYKGYKVFADSMEGNRKSDVYLFRGHVLLIGDTAVVKGSSVVVHFKSNFFAANDADADVKPAATNGYLLSDLYLKSAETYGTPKEQFERMMRVTTCEYEPPHYELVARTGTVRPHRRIILHDVDLFVKKVKIFHLPLVVIPLNQPPDRYIPEFGQSPDEGYYIKSRFAIDTHSQNNSLIARLDYMSKLGGAYGGDFQYGQGYTRNSASFYTLPGTSHMLLLQNHHDQTFGKLRVTFDNTYQRNDYLVATNTTNFTTRESFNLAQKSGNSNLTVSKNSTTAPGFSTSQDGVNLTDTRQFGVVSTNLAVNYAKYATASEGSPDTTRQQVDVSFTTAADLRKASAEFDYQRSIPIGDTSGFFSSADRTPMLTLRSDGAKLFGQKFGSNLPFTIEASSGELIDPVLNQHITRDSVDMSLNKQFNPMGKTSLGLNSRFRQGFYSDGTAQFLLAYGGQYSYSLGHNSAFNLNYNYQRPQGYAPLSMDQTGITDYASGDFSYQLRSVKVGAQSGYDFTEKGSPFLTTPWQSVGVRAEYEPNRKFLLRTLSSYDTTLLGWSSFRADATYQYRSMYVGLGSLYDAPRHTWATNDLNISGLHYGKVGFEARISYNGYLNKFQAQQYAFVYDLHDSELILQWIDSQTGFRSGRTINLFLRLKALPFNNLFGFGSQGQAIGSGTGRSF